LLESSSWISGYRAGVAKSKKNLQEFTKKKPRGPEKAENLYCLASYPSLWVYTEKNIEKKKTVSETLLTVHLFLDLERGPSILYFRRLLL